MKKNIISLGLVLVSLAVSFGQTNVFIPDSNFKAYLLSRTDSINVNADTAISFQEAANFKGRINVNGLGITTIKGIEAFTNLTYLDCSYNELTSLDLSKNISLNKLYCYNNYINSLDVTKNIGLTELHCYYNHLNSLDLSQNKNLTNLLCYYNLLTSLDINKNINLTNLVCYQNLLNSLDVSKNIELQVISCYDNQLDSLDLSKNTNLTFLDFSNNQFTSLDVTNNRKLTHLYCNKNKINSLNLTKNTELTNLYCSKNQLTNLDVNLNKSLKFLYCSKNKLNSLDLSKIVSLYYLDARSNPFLICIGISTNQNTIDYALNSNWQKDSLTIYSTTPCPTPTNIDHTPSSTLTLYPNPAQNSLSLLLTESLQGTVSLIDLQGQTILSQAINDKNAQINTSGVSNGVYILKVISEKATYTKQVVIAR